MENWELNNYQKHINIKSDPPYGRSLEQCQELTTMRPAEEDGSPKHNVTSTSRGNAKDKIVQREDKHKTLYEPTQGPSPLTLHASPPSASFDGLVTDISWGSPLAASTSSLRPELSTSPSGLTTPALSNHSACGQPFVKSLSRISFAWSRS